MDKNFDFTTLESLIQRLENNTDPDLNSIVNDLIMLSRKAGHFGITMKEIASLCTLGFIVSQEPELESLLQYLLGRVSPVDELLN